MVIMKKIGQSAYLLPNSVMIGNGRVSETERIWVNYEGQSSRVGLRYSPPQRETFGNTSAYSN